MAWAQNLLGFCLFACASQTQKGWSIPETCHPSPNHCFDRPHPTLLSPLLGVGGMGGSPSIKQQNQINTRLYHESSACFVVTALQRSSGSLNYDLKDRRPNETTSGELQGTFRRCPSQQQQRCAQDETNGDSFE